MEDRRSAAKWANTERQLIDQAANSDRSNDPMRSGRASPLGVTIMGTTG